MAKRKRNIFDIADERGLLDHPREDGKDKERKPIHERKLAFARVGREALTSQLERGHDIEEKNLKSRVERAAERKARAEEEQIRTPSPKPNKVGLKSKLGKRKRDHLGGNAEL